ncbi:TetR/AcrR family transcriptional regulator [Micromonospora echinofusca]|nr:TetR/AcrR family transcriptional regulator [Micromonospora echinofusca]
MNVQSATLLEVATRVLLVDPTASLGDVARAAGVSRTTLYARFPTRQALLVALASEAMDLVEQAYAAARLDDGAVEQALRRLVELTVPLGSRVEFLLRERSLDIEPELVARYEQLDAPVIALMRRAQIAGQVRADLPAWWMATAVIGAVSTAWEAIADGRLAVRDAPSLVLDTVLSGFLPR